MTRIRVREVIDAPISDVWDELATVENHVTWMADAASLEILGGQRRGVETRFVCATRVGPLRTTDHMVVTEWRERRALGVRHAGLVTGEGRFSLRRSARNPTGRTVVTWSEELTFPWYLGGPFAGSATKPVLRRIWRGNLRRLSARCGGASTRGTGGPPRTGWRARLTRSPRA